MFNLQPQICCAKKERRSIHQHPEYSRSKRISLTEMLEEEANYSSASLEIPHRGVSMGVTKSETGEIDSPHILKEKVRTIWEESLDYLNHDGATIDSRLIVNLGQKFDPRNGGYRAVRVSMKDFKYVPPNAIKVPELMSNLLMHLNDQQSDPLERAILAHFHIIRIQPFVDGNKRTARMIQNLILHKGEYFPIRVREAERDFYRELLDQAMVAFNDRCASSPRGAADCLQHDLSTEEKRFYDYLIAKEMVAMEKVKEELNKNRGYIVSLEGHPPELLYAAKKVLSGFFRKRNLPGQVRLNREEHNLNILGDMSKENVVVIL